MKLNKYQVQRNSQTMADEEKKISFGFSKTIKKSALRIPLKQEEKKVDYIECLDKKAIRILGQQDIKCDELVIPMLGSRSWHDRIINKADANVFGPDIEHKRNEKNGTISGGIENVDASLIKNEVSDTSNNLSTSLEQQAACEIIQDLKKKEIKVEDSNLVVPICQDETLGHKEESTMEDYERTPISNFGLAVLRGMGWKPGKGIGKNEKLIAVSLPELRPRGMGLGADKANRGNQETVTNPKTEEPLKVEKGSFIKIVGGKWKSNYGQIEGFDDGAGRLFVKLALSGDRLSLNESTIQPVTKTEYEKNSKLLNNAKFEKYTKMTHGSVENSNSETSETQQTEKNYLLDVNKKKKSKKNEDEGGSSKKWKKIKKRSKNWSFPVNSDTDDRSNRRKNSSASDSDNERKKCRKRDSKSGSRRDSSAERLIKKNKKKDKRMEKMEFLDRRRHKKSHKSMRSRSSDER